MVTTYDEWKTTEPTPAHAGAHGIHCNLCGDLVQIGETRVDVSVGADGKEDMLRACLACVDGINGR